MQPISTWLVRHMPHGITRRLASWGAVVTVAGMMVGCSTTHRQETRDPTDVAGVNLAGGESVTVFLNYLGLEGRAIEGEIVGCIRDGIHRAHPELRVVPPDEFRRLAFPNLAPDAAPRSPQYLAMLLDNPAFRERIAPLNLHYLIVIGGETRVKHIGGMMAGSAPAPAGAFLLGGWVWDRDTQLTASVLDLKQARRAAEMNATARGTAWLVVIQGLPLGAPALTEAKACTALGDKVARFLVEPAQER